MYRIQAKIRSCHHLANTIRLLLDEALDLANDANYDAHWIAAINTAIKDNLKVWRHTYNVATCIDPTAPLPSSDEARKHGFWPPETKGHSTETAQEPTNGYSSATD